MSRARELSRLGNINVLSGDDINSEVGIASTVPRSTLDVRGEMKVGTAIQAGTAGVLTATSFDGALGGNIVASACTFTTGTFTGNVTIGGTLTYEDVTNIDALGIVTARAGVNVSGGQLAVGVAYSVGAAGVATAAGFVGPLTGAVTGNADTATTATNVTVADESSDSTCFLLFTTAATGNLPPKTGDNLTFNSATGILVAGGVNSDVTGNLTGTASNASGATGDFSIADKIIHTGDTDTAIRFPAANTISAEAGATEKVRIDSTGIGIGTAPAEEVHILGATPTLLVEGTNTGSGGIVADVDVRAQHYRKAGYSISDSNATEDIFIGRPYASGDTTAPLVFDFQGVEKVRFRHDGLVGFGTNNPSYEMEVRKTGQVDLLIGSYDANGARIMLDGDSDGDGSGGDFSEIVHDTSGDLTINARDPAGNSNLLLKTGGNTERARIDSSGRLMVGTTGTTIAGLNAYLQVEGLSGETGAISVTRNSNDAGGPYLMLSKSRGTSDNSENIVSAGDRVGTILFNPADGNDKAHTAASIAVEIDGTPGSNDIPGRLIFNTTADGASTVTERLRIGAAGQVGLSGANYGTSGQVITSNGSSSAPTWQDAGGVWTQISNTQITSSTNYVDLSFGANAGITTGYAEVKIWHDLWLNSGETLRMQGAYGFSGTFANDVKTSDYWWSGYWHRAGDSGMNSNTQGENQGYALIAGNNSKKHYAGEIIIFNGSGRLYTTGSVSRPALMYNTQGYMGGDNDAHNYTVSGHLKGGDNNPLQGVRIYGGSAIIAGEIRMYGLTA